MTPALLDRPASLFADPGAAERAADTGRAADTERATRLRAGAGPIEGGRVTLEERLNSVLHEARTNGSTECPTCHARMARTSAAAGAAPAGAECGGCGSRLT
jgi:hypothetical protein